MTQSNTALPAIPVDTGKTPKNGAKAIPVSYDFSVQASYTTDLTYSKTQGRMEIFQSLMIDNSAGSQGVTVTMPATGQKMAVPPNSQGLFPIFAGGSPVFTVASQGNQVVNIFYSDAPIPSATVWSTTLASVTIGGTITTADTILDATVTNNKVQTLETEAPATIVDHSGTITVGGVAQTAANANATRRGYLIQNLDAGENLYVRLGASAVIDGPGSYLLPPYASLLGVGTQLINVIAATTNHKFTLTDW